jgi:hypothetical protein
LAWDPIYYETAVRKSQVTNDCNIKFDIWLPIKFEVWSPTLNKFTEINGYEEATYDVLPIDYEKSLPEHIRFITILLKKLYWISQNNFGGAYVGCPICTIRNKYKNKLNNCSCVKKDGPGKNLFKFSSSDKKLIYSIAAGLIERKYMKRFPYRPTIIKGRKLKDCAKDIVKLFRNTYKYYKHKK